MTEDSLDHRRISEQDWKQFSDERKVDFVQSRDAVVMIEESGVNITPCHLRDDTICTQEILETHDDGSPKVLGCTNPRYSKTMPPKDCTDCPLNPG
jgi:hypothetical protein